MGQPGSQPEDGAGDADGLRSYFIIRDPLRGFYNTRPSVCPSQPPPVRSTITTYLASSSSTRHFINQSVFLLLIPPLHMCARELFSKQTADKSKTLNQGVTLNLIIRQTRHLSQSEHVSPLARSQGIRPEISIVNYQGARGEGRRCR